MSGFLQACRGERVSRIPVWFMRQAGRSLPGYRKLRETYGVLELTQTPELAAQVSLEPVERLGVDAAILFADIMLLPINMGVGVKIVDAVGPVIDAPIAAPADVQKLAPFSREKNAFLEETIRILRRELKVPVIGFSGAPFTLASYLIEGKPSRDWRKTKRFMLEEPEAWDALMMHLSGGIVEYLSAQIEAGAQAVQLFDSWVGCLSPELYRAQVFPHVKRIFEALASKNVPRIHFGTDTNHLLFDIAQLPIEVVGLDWRTNLAAAQKLLRGKAVQGNLDPAVLTCGWDVIKAKTDEMLSGADAHRGYVFNLGHGMPPEADDALVQRLVEYVHAR